MLPKLHRAQLRTNRSFFRQARRLKTPLGLFLWLPSDQDRTVTVIAGKKIHSSAVQRHELKRRWRAAAYALIKQELLPPGTWALYPNRSSLALRGTDLVEALQQAISTGVSTYGRVRRATD